MALASLPMAVLLLQAPRAGWPLDQEAGHLKCLYCDLFQASLVPEEPDPRLPRVNLIF
jgi:hypothetical protein